MTTAAEIATAINLAPDPVPKSVASVWARDVADLGIRQGKRIHQLDEKCRHNRVIAASYCRYIEKLEYRSKRLRASLDPILALELETATPEEIRDAVFTSLRIYAEMEHRPTMNDTIKENPANETQR